MYLSILAVVAYGVLRDFMRKPVAHLRQEEWNMLRELNNISRIPWMIMGNFNEVLCSSEQKGGMRKSQSQIKGFQDTIDACGLGDLRFRTIEYTWSNRRENEHDVEVRLDKAFANNEWVLLTYPMDIGPLTHYDRSSVA